MEFSDDLNSHPEQWVLQPGFSHHHSGEQWPASDWQRDSTNGRWISFKVDLVGSHSCRSTSLPLTLHTSGDQTALKHKNISRRSARASLLLIGCIGGRTVVVSVMGERGREVTEKLWRERVKQYLLCACVCVMLFCLSASTKTCWSSLSSHFITVFPALCYQVPQETLMHFGSFKGCCW